VTGAVWPDGVAGPDVAIAQLSVGVARNTAINVAGAILPLAASVLTVPLYLTYVGESRYGVLAICWLLLGYFGFADIGIGRATANIVARVAADDTETATAVLTAAAVALAVGALGGAMLFGIGHLLFGDVIRVGEDVRREVLAGLLWLSGAVPLVSVSSVFTGALEGRERFLLVNAIRDAEILVVQIAPLAVARIHGPDMQFLLAAVALAPLTSVALGSLAFVRTFARADAIRVSRVIVMRLARAASWMSVTGILGPLMTMFDRIAVGAIVNARAVAYYIVPYNLVFRLQILPLSHSRALFPRFSSLQARDAHSVASNAAWHLTTVMTPLVLTALVLLEPALVLWVGADFASKALPVGVILLVGVWINSLALIPFTFLQAQARADLPAKLYLAEFGPYVVALLVGLKIAGIRGAAVAAVARIAVDAGLLWRFSRLQVRSASQVAFNGTLVLGTAALALTILDSLPLRLGIGLAALAGVLVAARSARAAPSRSLAEGQIS
jgi:O-antigen/teichoic acid export membrane protein